MKIRTSYVSNSSSSSFCIMGIVVDDDDVLRVYKCFLKDAGKANDIDGEELNDWDFYNMLKEMGVSFECGIGSYYDRYVIGLDIGEMKDDETKVQFRERAFEVCERFGLSKENVDWVVDGGYDG